MSSEEPAISIRGLGKSYAITHAEIAPTSLAESLSQRLRHPFRGAPKETLWALRDLSLDVPRGQVLGVIGSNGAGKSTLLKILSRITEPTTGTVDLHGRVGSLLEVGTGFHRELTGRENVYLNGSILGMSKREIDRRFEEIVAFSGVERFLDTPVKRYSSGMYVRLAFSVAAHLETEILIVDEVLAVGDAEFQKRCLGKMKDVAEGGRTVLFVSHNLGMISELCQRCVHLADGRSVADGPSGEVVSRYVRRETDRGEIDVTEWTKDRLGDGSLRVRSVATLDDSGRPRSTFRYGEPITFRVRAAGTAGEGCTIGVSIRDEMGHMVLHVSNRDDDAELVFGGDEGEFDVRLARQPLNDGTYYVSIWLGDAWNHLSDRIGNCLEFEIDSRRDGRVVSTSPIRLPAEWTCRKPDERPRAPAVVLAGAPAG